LIPAKAKGQLKFELPLHLDGISLGNCPNCSGKFAAFSLGQLDFLAIAYSLPDPFEIPCKIGQHLSSSIFKNLRPFLPYG
jgi:hypothetical protein